MLEAEIRVFEEPELAYDVFQPEDKFFNNNRASYEVLLDKINNKKFLLIKVKAKDPTAFRAVITSITRILNIVRKSKNE